MKKLDLNSDMGEGFGAWEMGNDFALLDDLTSINIACGWHAGDPQRMRPLIDQALKNNVHIGAHPSHPDLAGFGRREMMITPQDAYDFVLYQSGALQAFIHAAGGKLHHVKPHGALYNQAAKNLDLARGIARAVKDLGEHVILYGLASSCFVEAAEEFNVPIWQEVFADRRYTATGALVPRSHHRAMIEDEQEALQQVKMMSEKGLVNTLDNTQISVQADTLCVHGDNPHALEFLRLIKKEIH